MDKQIKIQMGLLIVTTLFFICPNVASAKNRFGAGLSGPIGIHASTNGGVGVTLPTPAISTGTHGVSVTATPTGVQTNYSNPQGVSAGVSSDGNYYGAFQQDLPGNVTTSSGINNGDVSTEANVNIPLN